ncbi:hypothetical protein AAZX31_08G274300 [Glycine max]
MSKFTSNPASPSFIQPNRRTPPPPLPRRKLRPPSPSCDVGISLITQCLPQFSKHPFSLSCDTDDKESILMVTIMVINA